MIKFFKEKSKINLQLAKKANIKEKSRNFIIKKKLKKSKK